MTRQVLFVGGHTHTLSPLRDALHKEPYEIVLLDGSSAAYAYLAERKASVVVADENLGQVRGADFLAEVQK
ncbi:MAG TPA: hypothetical protein VN764_18720, partial [Polyangiaceae bacterium]|nr:hypothetical protein [Polyangiaceae bacterium]